MAHKAARRLTATVAGVGALALVLTACSSGSTSSSGTTSAATSAAGGGASGSAAAGGESGDWCQTIKDNWGDLTGKTITYYTTVGDEEKATWLGGFKPFEDCTGATIQWDGSKEFEAQIKVSIASGNPPDVANFPQPGLISSVVNETGAVKPAPQIVADAVDANYNEAFKGYGTVNDIFFAAPLDANVKSFVWYSPKTFKEKGYTVPTTYDELIALTDKIAQENTGQNVKPWCAGIASGDATGWPATDWLEDYMVRMYGTGRLRALGGARDPVQRPEGRRRPEQGRRDPAQPGPRQRRLRRRRVDRLHHLPGRRSADHEAAVLPAPPGQLLRELLAAGHHGGRGR